jgi:SLOG cluster4 family
VTLSVCVFCSSAGGLPEVYRSAARDLGAELAARGHRLVYGGGNVGLMGEVARSVHEHGGTVVGVIPKGLVDRELAYRSADELLVNGTMRDHNDTFCSRPMTGQRALFTSGRAGSTGRRSRWRLPWPAESRPLLALWLHRPAATIGPRARRDRPGETREPW